MTAADGTKVALALGTRPRCHLATVDPPPYRRATDARTPVSTIVVLVLAAEQITRYDADGFLVLPGFVSLDACAALRTRANEIVDSWEPSEERSVFTTNQQERVSNGEFLASGASTWCFFEEEAFAPDGELTQAKELSINKIGHAQHDTDDEFANSPTTLTSARWLAMSV